VKYGAAHQPITVTIRLDDVFVWIEVHNEGNLIPVEDQAILFSPFRRAKSAETSGKTGWGLGLTLVRGIAEAHGGTVFVESSVEAGTVFRAKLPRDAR
jgi:signal transduction histidine kinase